MSFLASIGAKVWGYVAAFGGFILAMLLFWNKAKKAGKKEVKDAVNAKSTDKVIDTIKKEKEIEKDIKATPASSRREQLRRYTSDSGSE